MHSHFYATGVGTPDLLLEEAHAEVILHLLAQPDVVRAKNFLEVSDNLRRNVHTGPPVSVVRLGEGKPTRYGVGMAQHDLYIYVPKPDGAG
eukprot:CAMPEP_0194312230 /NCGR_PEP_ID=MMETSP0171-20130528/9160_1 /TAXON_ID=218684 /ORGANISM="Corethron pennatum, Strain L29A3" /LENGTH=90 /DNA_ID=CAMNT_0039066659 /DNA_START=485 /DNA_END=757 /DNA_ORIENTATION=-